MKSRSNLAQLEERVDFAKDLLIKRNPKSQIIHQLKKRFKIQDRQAANYISKAFEHWKEASVESRNQRREEQREALLGLYQEARNKNEYAVCVQIEKLLVKIDGTEIAPNDLKRNEEPLTLVIRDYRDKNPEV